MEKKDKKKRGMGWKIAGVVIAVILVALIAVALRYLISYNGFLDKITARRPEVKQYSVIVKSDSEYNELDALKDKNVGFLETDPKVGNAEQYLTEKVAIQPSLYDGVDTLMIVFSGEVVDAIVLDSDTYAMLGDEAEEQTKDTRVIYTFEIELESEVVEAVDKKVTEEPFIVYISGSDSRAGIKATARSDVNIIAVVNPAKEKILLVSIPRDTYVQLHGTTGLRDKLTHAGVYGIDMSKATIEDFLGIKIDYTLKVSFDTVVKVVDQLDGIEIDSDTAMKLKTEGGNKTCEYIVGKQTVDGDCALRFARERKTYTTGDRHRGENQQQVITSIIGKLSSSKDYILKIPTILDIAADSFETSLSRENVSDFIRLQLLNRPKWQVESIAVDGSGSMQPTYSMGANWPLYVMLAYPESVEKATAKINEYML